MTANSSPPPSSQVHDQWRCMHAPQCEARFDTLDALNKHLDSTLHECCQVHPKPAGNAPSADDGEGDGR